MDTQKVIQKPTPVWKLADFVRVLRTQGLDPGIAQTADAARALEIVGFEDRETVRVVLKALLTGSRRDQQVFDRCFDLYFVSEEAYRNSRDALDREREQMEQLRLELEQRLSVEGHPIEMREDLKDVYARMPQEERDRLKAVVDRFSENMEQSPKLYEGFIRSVFMKSLLEQQLLLEDAAEGAARADSDADLIYRDITAFRDQDIPKVYQLIDQITRRINGEFSARRRRADRAVALDYRRTIRAGLSTGGALCRLHYKGQRDRRKHIVMLCDVSSSMLRFSQFAIRFVKSLSEVSERSDLFLFSEQVQRVSPFALQTMERFSDYVRTSGVWGRGTNVGRALESVLNASPAVLTPNTLLLIFSDAKSVRLDIARSALIRASQASGGVVWMNPIPQSKWPYLKGVSLLRQYCDMVPSATLDELAGACRRLLHT